jgi:hypothetical protein
MLFKGRRGKNCIDLGDFPHVLYSDATYALRSCENTAVWFSRGGGDGTAVRGRGCVRIHQDQRDE